MRAKFIIEKDELYEWINEKLAKETNYTLSKKNSTVKAIDIYEGTSISAFYIEIEI